MKNPFVWFVVIVLFAGGAFIYTRQRQQAVPQAPSYDAATGASGADDSAGLMVGKNAVVASDQAPGKSVTVSAASLAKPGYVVIHHGTKDGKPGEVIGHSDLLSGEQKNINLSLTEMTEDGEAMFAMLHTDDGDSVYTFPGPDAPTKDDAGNVIMMKFMIVAGAKAPADTSL